MLCSAAKGALLSTNAPGRLASMGAAASDPGAHPGPAATARARRLGKFARGADGRVDLVSGERRRPLRENERTDGCSAEWAAVREKARDTRGQRRRWRLRGRSERRRAGWTH